MVLGGREKKGRGGKRRDSGVALIMIDSLLFLVCVSMGFESFVAFTYTGSRSSSGGIGACGIVA